MSTRPTGRMSLSLVCGSPFTNFLPWASVTIVCGSVGGAVWSPRARIITILVVMILARGLHTAPPTEPQTIVTDAHGKKFVNGEPQTRDNDIRPVGRVLMLPDGASSTGPLSPAAYLSTLQRSK